MPLWRHVYRNFTALAGFWDLGGALLRTRRLADSALSHITGGAGLLRLPSRANVPRAQTLSREHPQRLAGPGIEVSGTGLISRLCNFSDRLSLSLG